MTTRTGKIARLPFALREQLNRRLRENEPSDPLLAWLNALPEVQTLLKDQFQGSPISRQNLSDWRQGGFAEWEFRQEFAAEVLLDTQDIKGESAQIDQGGQEYLADALATVLCGRYASLIARWNGEVTAQLDQQLRFLHRLRVDITALRHSHHSNVRAEIARDQHNAKRQPRPQPAPGSAPAPGAVFRAPAENIVPTDHSPSPAQSSPIVPNQASTPDIGVGTARPHNPADTTPSAEPAPLPSPLSTLPAPTPGESSPIVPNQASEPSTPTIGVATARPHNPAKATPTAKSAPLPSAPSSLPPQAPSAPLIRIHPLPFHVQPARYIPAVPTQDDEMME